MTASENIKMYDRDNNVILTVIYLTGVAIGLNHADKFNLTLFEDYPK